MCKGTVLAILAPLAVEITLTILGFVSGRVVQLFNLVVSIGAIPFLTPILTALHMGVGHLSRVTTLVAVVVVIVAAG